MKAALFGICLSGLVTFGSAQTVRLLRPNELGGIRVWEDARTGQEAIPGTGNLRIYWNVRFKNETPRELASIFVRFVNETNGRRVFVSPPIEVKAFRNASLPFTGSILPFNKTDFVRLSFSMPKALWSDYSYLHPEFAGASQFTGRLDLHNPGHLFTWMYNHREPEILALFKKDPSLLKVRSPENFTVLLMALAAADPNVVEYVAAHGGSYRDKSKGGSTIMHLAAVGQYGGNLDLALRRGGKIDAKAISGRTPLFKAIEHGSLQNWKWLLSHKANPNAVCDRGTVMQTAVKEGLLPAVQDLLAAGAKRYDSTGQGPLHYAVFNYVMLGPIHDLGFPIDDADPRFGFTPLMQAAWSGWYEPQVWLLQHGADPRRKDRRGKSAYDYCRQGRRYFDSLVRRFSK